MNMKYDDKQTELANNSTTDTDAPLELGSIEISGEQGDSFRLAPSEEEVSTADQIMTEPTGRLSGARAEQYYEQIEDGNLALASMNRLGIATQDPSEIVADRELREVSSLESSPGSPDLHANEQDFQISDTELPAEFANASQSHPAEYRSNMVFECTGKIINFTKSGLFMSNPNGADIYVPKDVIGEHYFRRGDELRVRATRRDNGKLTAERVLLESGTGKVFQTFLGQNSEVLGKIRADNGDEIHFNMRAADERINSGAVDYLVVKGDRGLRAVRVARHTD